MPASLSLTLQQITWARSWQAASRAPAAAAPPCGRSQVLCRARAAFSGRGDAGEGRDDASFTSREGARSGEHPAALRAAASTLMAAGMCTARPILLEGCVRGQLSILCHLSHHPPRLRLSLAAVLFASCGPSAAAVAEPAPVRTEEARPFRSAALCPAPTHSRQHVSGPPCSRAAQDLALAADIGQEFLYKIDQQRIVKKALEVAREQAVEKQARPPQPPLPVRGGVRPPRGVRLPRPFCAPIARVALSASACPRGHAWLPSERVASLRRATDRLAAAHSASECRPSQRPLSSPPSRAAGWGHQRHHRAPAGHEGGAALALVLSSQHSRSQRAHAGPSPAERMRLTPHAFAPRPSAPRRSPSRFLNPRRRRRRSESALQRPAHSCPPLLLLSHPSSLLSFPCRTAPLLLRVF